MRTHDAELRRHPVGAVPYFTYSEGDNNYIVYCEDARSLLAKITTIESLGFSKDVFWSLGRQDPELLDALGTRYRGIRNK